MFFILALRMNKLGGISDGVENLLAREVGVISQYVVNGLVSGQLIENELDGDTCASNRRTPALTRWIRDNTRSKDYVGCHVRLPLLLVSCMCLRKRIGGCPGP